MKLRNLVYNTKHNRIISICLVLMISFGHVNYLLNDILIVALGLPSVSAIIYGLMAVIGIYSYFIVLYDGKLNKYVFLITSFLFIGTIISYALYPDIKEVFITPDYNPLNSGLIYLVLYAIPVIIYTSKNTDWLYTINFLKIISIIIISLAFADYYMNVIVSFNFDKWNYMSFSYSILTSSSMFFLIGALNRNKLFILLSIFSFSFIAVVGARGAALSNLIFNFFILYIIKRKKNVSFLLLTSIVVIIIFLNRDILLMIISLLDKFDINSRVFTSLLEGHMFESDGRDALSDIAINAIFEKPFLGYGIWGDRYVTSINGFHPVYVHNLFLEFMCHYGIVFGITLLFILFYQIYKKYKILSHNHPMVQFLLILIPYGIFRLFVTGSYLDDLCFWAIVGILINNKTLETRKYEKYSNSNNRLQ